MKKIITTAILSIALGLGLLAGQASTAEAKTVRSAKVCHQIGKYNTCTAKPAGPIKLPAPKCITIGTYRWCNVKTNMPSLQKPKPKPKLPHGVRGAR